MAPLDLVSFALWCLTFAWFLEGLGPVFLSYAGGSAGLTSRCHYGWDLCHSLRSSPIIFLISYVPSAANCWSINHPLLVLLHFS